MSKACRTCQFITAVVHTSLDTEAVVYLSLCVHHRCLFAERTSSGQRRSRCVLTAYFMEGVAEHKRAGTSGDTCLHRAQARR